MFKGTIPRATARFLRKYGLGADCRTVWHVHCGPPVAVGARWAGTTHPRNLGRKGT
jgi:hypothetical protein